MNTDDPTAGGSLGPVLGARNVILSLYPELGPASFVDWRASEPLRVEWCGPGLADHRAEFGDAGPGSKFSPGRIETFDTALNTPVGPTCGYGSLRMSASTTSISKAARGEAQGHPATRASDPQRDPRHPGSRVQGPNHPSTTDPQASGIHADIWIKREHQGIVAPDQFRYARTRSERRLLRPP